MDWFIQSLSFTYLWWTLPTCQATLPSARRGSIPFLPAPAPPARNLRQVTALCERKQSQEPSVVHCLFFSFYTWSVSAASSLVSRLPASSFPRSPVPFSHTDWPPNKWGNTCKASSKRCEYSRRLWSFSITTDWSPQTNQRHARFFVACPIFSHCLPWPIHIPAPHDPGKQALDDCFSTLCTVACDQSVSSHLVAVLRVSSPTGAVFKCHPLSEAFLRLHSSKAGLFFHLYSTVLYTDISCCI